MAGLFAFQMGRNIFYFYQYLSDDPKRKFPMNAVLKLPAVLALLSACSAPSPQERAATLAANADIAKQVSAGMAAPAPVVVGECLRLIETGSFSPDNLLNAGFGKGSVFGAGAYNIAVSGPVKQGFAERPLTLGVNIGPNTAVNFQPGCRIILPSQGNAALPFAVAASKAARANRYAFKAGGRRSFTFTKSGQSIRMTIVRKIMSGTSFVEAMIR